MYHEIVLRCVSQAVAILPLIDSIVGAGSTEDNGSHCFRDSSTCKMALCAVKKAAFETF